MYDKYHHQATNQPNRLHVFLEVDGQMWTSRDKWTLLKSDTPQASLDRDSEPR